MYAHIQYISFFPYAIVFVYGMRSRWQHQRAEKFLWKGLRFLPPGSHKVPANPRFYRGPGDRTDPGSDRGVVPLTTPQSTAR